MKSKIKLLALAISGVLISNAAIAATDTDAKITVLQLQVAQLQNQQNANLIDRVNVSGFISGAFIIADNNTGYAGASQRANFSNDSKFGLQGSFAINDTTNAVVQVVMRGENDWNTDIEFAFLAHQFDNSLIVRAGKLRLPLFMYSDYMEVGYAQPWARPVEEVYGAVPFSTYVGADTTYNIELTDSTITMQVFGGESDQDAYGLKNIVGGNISWTDEIWTFRGTYNRGEVFGNMIRDKKVIIALNNELGTFLGFGASYDDGRLMMISEWTRSEVEGQYADTDAAYVTLGYRLGSVMPYATYSYLETIDNKDRSDILSYLLDGERSAYSLGLRWDAMPNIAIKADVTYATDFGDTNGGILANSFSRNEDSLVYTVKFDAVF